MQFNQQLNGLLERAKNEGKAHTNYENLSVLQLTKRIKHYSSKLNDQKLKNMNVEKKLFNSYNRLSHYRRLINLLSQNDIARVSTLLNTFLRSNSSVTSLIEKLNQAINGEY